MTEEHLKNINGIVKNFLVWLLLLVVLVVAFSSYNRHDSDIPKINYSQFVQEVKDDKLVKVEIENRDLKVTRHDGSRYTSYLPLNDQNLLSQLLERKVEVVGVPPEQPGLLTQIFINWFPMLLLIGVWLFVMRQMNGGGKNGPFSFGKSRARTLDGGKVKVRFSDVAGVEEAKEEVKELVDYLRNPKKFQRLGGKIPCGILLLGPPGTGKTLLAKAVAGEAGVPFFSISGSDFVEMFVGVGASRVRDLFENAKKQAPCIIFIDEIDAVGRHRGAGLGGGHDEREQTLNQLLVEMDGFVGKTGIIVIAATNRPDVLDPALLRPGRFDRQVPVSLPDVKGREQILEVHMHKVAAAEDVDPLVLARGTPGMSGADLANLVNEAALLAARHDHSKVELQDFEQAKDKILMGSERRSMVLDASEKELTAYHEAGHVVVGYMLRDKDHDPIYKASIIPRGRALGVTMFLPEKDRYNYSKQRLNSAMCGLFGGRLAELIKFGRERITTGASNDLERATAMARNMITKWGFSEKLGPLVYDSEEGEIFLGRSITDHKKMSDATAQEVDAEIRALVMRNYHKAEQILRKNWDRLELLAKGLMELETLEEQDIINILEHGVDVTLAVNRKSKVTAGTRRRSRRWGNKGQHKKMVTAGEMGGSTGANDKVEVRIAPDQVGVPDVQVSVVPDREDGDAGDSGTKSMRAGKSARRVTSAEQRTDQLHVDQNVGDGVSAEANERDATGGQGE